MGCDVLEVRLEVTPAAVQKDQRGLVDGPGFEEARTHSAGIDSIDTIGATQHVQPHRHQCTLGPLSKETPQPR